MVTRPGDFADVDTVPAAMTDVVQESTHDVVTDAQRDAADGTVGPVSRWAVHRRMYDWVIALADRPGGVWALAGISFAESSFFPIPPDVLLAPLCLGKRSRAWWFALVCTVASVAGAVLGYWIGAAAWGAMQEPLYRWVPGFTAEKFATVEAWYEHWGIWILFAAAFTPIPFKVFTIAGGVLGQPLLPFIVVSLIGRGMRFFLVAGLFWWIGPRAMPFIDKYFNWLCVGFVVLLVLGVVVLEFLH